MSLFNNNFLISKQFRIFARFRQILIWREMFLAARRLAILSERFVSNNSSAVPLWIDGKAVQSKTNKWIDLFNPVNFF